MDEGPVAALPVQQQQSNRLVYPQAVGVSLDGLQGQVPFQTQRSGRRERTMSERAPLLNCAPALVAGCGQMCDEQKMDISSFCESVKRRNGHCGDTVVSQVEAQCGATLPRQQEKRTTMSSRPDKSVSTFSPVVGKSARKHLPTSEDSSLDVLRIVKHQPSVIVFCDYDDQLFLSNGSSDSGEASSSSAGEGDSDEDDDFPETLQYKEFLVSRRRRNLSRNRKCLRKRQDAQPSSSASDRQTHSSQSREEFTVTAGHLCGHSS